MSFPVSLCRSLYDFFLYALFSKDFRNLFISFFTISSAMTPFTSIHFVTLFPNSMGALHCTHCNWEHAHTHTHTQKMITRITQESKKSDQVRLRFVLLLRIYLSNCCSLFLPLFVRGAIVIWYVSSYLSMFVDTLRPLDENVPCHRRETENEKRMRCPSVGEKKWREAQGDVLLLTFFCLVKRMASFSYI